MGMEKTQISKIRNKKGEITNNKEIQGIISNYFKKVLLGKEGGGGPNNVYTCK
jgi:hypothetical protein